MIKAGVGCSSGSSALCSKSLDPAWRIDRAWWAHLQFGLFAIPTSGPQLNVLSCLWESAYTNNPRCLLQSVPYVVTVGFF